MRDMMWIYAAVILLVSDALSLEPDIRNLTFKQGSDFNLTCSDKTWDETMFVIWKIHLKHYVCKIAFSNDGQSTDSCNDGKSLRNTSRSQSYLHISNFSVGDMGVYKCELVYNGGKKNCLINVAITVPPTVSVWLDSKDNKRVAVCRAEGGKPAANISWSHMGDSLSVEKLSSKDGFITVESRLEITEGMDAEYLTCAVMHLSWEQKRLLVLKLQAGDFPWVRIVIIVLILVVLMGCLILALKKNLILLRRCQQSDTSPSKFPPMEDVEEVEPYASYVQRVNSIYN